MSESRLKVIQDNTKTENWTSVAEWLARQFNPSAAGRRAGSIPDIAEGVVCLSPVLQNSLVAVLYMVMFSWPYVILCGA